MPTSPTFPGLPAHPHQLEVQEFDTYALIVDLRGAADYEDDHLPGAVSVPWSGQPTPLSVEEGNPGLIYALEAKLAAVPRGEPVLAYCGRGGLDSAEVAAQLQRRGHVVHVLPGGWANYRRWVTTSIEVLSRVLSFRWVRSPPGGAGQAVLAVLEAQGLQVLPLASILSQQRLPGLLLHGDAVPSQPAFETRLVDALRRLDPGRVVWVDETLLLGDGVGLPEPLRGALRRAPSLTLDVDLAIRVEALRSQLEAQAAPLVSLIDAVADSVVGIAPAGRPLLLDAVRLLADQGRSGEAITALLTECIDRLYDEFAPPKVADADAVLRLASLSPTSIWAYLQTLPEPWPDNLQPDEDQISP